MNIALLFKEKVQTIDDLLADGHWQYTDQYTIEPEASNYLGVAHIYHLSKQITVQEEAALVYLLQRLYMEDADSNENAKPLSAHNLLHWLIGGGYINPNESSPGSSQGVSLDPSIGWNKLQEGIRELLAQPCHVYKNGQEIAPVLLFDDHQVKAVTALKITRRMEYSLTIYTLLKPIRLGCTFLGAMCCSPNRNLYI